MCYNEENFDIVLKEETKPHHKWRKRSMKKYRMSTKLSLTYAVLIIALISAGLITFYNYNKGNIHEEGIGNLGQIVDATMVQVDDKLTNMGQVIVDILTDKSFLAKYEEAQELRDEESEREVKRTLTTAYANRTDIRRVSVFSEDGYFISTGMISTNQAEVAKRTKRILDEYSFEQVSNIVLSPHEDSWDSGTQGKVISEIKPIRNSKEEIVGYMEVQQNSFYLENICDLKWSGHTLNNIMFMGEGKELFYANFDTERYSDKYIEMLQGFARQYTRFRETEDSIIATANSNNYPCEMIFILEKSVLYRSMESFTMVLIVAAITLLLFTIIYITGVTKSIMRPIDTFIERMKRTDIRNLAVDQDYEKMDYETGILVKGLNEMAYRLQTATDKQKRLEEMQTKTLFSILQSEINPHFLYNTMGSIANMCELGEGEAAANACYDLSDIIRYSSNYATSEVSIKEEISNLQSYLRIMKNRYRQRLDYEMNVEEEVKQLTIPKLTFQPLVENAIKYSLLEQEQVVVRISARMIEGNAILEITDNGCGIADREVAIIKRRVEEFKYSEEHQETLKKIQEGGMGLSGTLIRLSIFFEGRFTYELLDNNDEKGMSISLCINSDDN